MMEKQNLVTLRDSIGLYDLLKCTKCGFKKKYYGLSRPAFCPRCKDGQKKKSVLIFGGWTHRDIKDCFCAYCKAPAILTPKEGHSNSQYWALQRDKDEILYCCPNGCLEDGSWIFTPQKKWFKLNRRKE